MDCKADGDETERMDEFAKADSHVHDIGMLFSADSPHPTRLICENCDWVGDVSDGV